MKFFGGERCLFPSPLILASLLSYNTFCVHCEIIGIIEIPKVEEKEELYGTSVSSSNGLGDEGDDNEHVAIFETNLSDEECVILDTPNFIVKRKGRLSWISAVCHDTRNVQTKECDIKNENDNSGDDTEDDCIILERNPFEKVISVVNPLLKHRLESKSCRYLNRTTKPDEYVFVDDDDIPVNCSDDKNHVVVEGKLFKDEILNLITRLPEKVYFNSGIDSQNWEEDEISVLAERGQVACRDYPHPRHLCAQHTFNTTPHEAYCCQCYCYVCDIKAPCEFWDGKLESHCHASELDNKWKDLRDAGRQTTGK